MGNIGRGKKKIKKTAIIFEFSQTDSSVQLIYNTILYKTKKKVIPLPRDLRLFCL